MHRAAANKDGNERSEKAGQYCRTLFHRLGQESFARRHQRWLVNHRDGSRLSFQYLSQISNRLGQVFFELRRDLINEGPVLGLASGREHGFDGVVAELSSPATSANRIPSTQDRSAKSRE